MRILEIDEDHFQEEVINYPERTLIDFNATWCGPCRMLKPILEEFECMDNNLKVVSIDIDDNENLGRLYHISSIPCLVLLENGQEINRSIGLIDADELASFIGEK